MDKVELRQGVEGEPTALTRIVFLWKGVSEAELSFYSSDVRHLDFASADGLIKTIFEQHPDGIEGHIVAELIEVVSLEVEPGETDSSSSLPRHHEVRWTFTD